LSAARVAKWHYPPRAAIIDGMNNEIEKTIIDGGAVTLVERMPSMHTASVGFWVAFGSRYEPEGDYGSAHFIEHMLFKGTRSMGPRELAMAVEDVGGSIGASASEERTRLYARALPEHIPLVIDIMADMFRRSVFPADEFDREREVVLEEIKGHDDTPEEIVTDNFIQDIYGLEGLGHSILGYEADIAGMTRDKLFELYEKFYRPAHLVVSAAGNLGGLDIPALVAKAIEPCSLPPCKALVSPQSEPDFSTKAVIRRKDIQQTHFCLGFPGAPYKSPDRYKYMLLDMILSGGMSSRLFYEVRELRGLVYDIMTSNSSFSDTGFFYVSASTRPDNLAEVLDVTISELNKVTSGQVSLQELDRVKSQLKVSITMSMESVGGRMSKLAQSEIFYGRNVADEEILEKILEVKPEDVCELAAEVFRADRAVFSGLGPYKGRKAAAAERLALDSISKLSR